MTRSRSRIGGTLLLASVLAGCLFPSFDGLRGSDDPGDDDTPDGSTTPPTTRPTSTPTTTPTTMPAADASVDAGVDAGPALPKAVACDGRTCAAPSTFCCADMITDDECMPQNRDPEGDCAFLNFGNARAMRCDGPEDCNAGEQCCFVDSSNRGAFCSAAACGGRVLCHPGGAACPVGSCSGTVLSRYAFCQ